ncbi:hypothetical protein HPP92_003343 [Vanilla planifolia]|uniref:Uncharacterized protein n=1 Tax=Vanilla planifolia TaxID=51239 RepID=A0A835S3F6_VANPL|nr:hypothetical protein HPP92_003343 [Vanilla planifolia]
MVVALMALGALLATGFGALCGGVFGVEVNKQVKHLHKEDQKRINKMLISGFFTGGRRRTEEITINLHETLHLNLHCIDKQVKHLHKEDQKRINKMLISGFFTGGRRRTEEITINLPFLESLM